MKTLTNKVPLHSLSTFLGKNVIDIPEDGLSTDRNM